MNCEEKTVEKKLLYDGRIMQLYNDKVELADGSFSHREYIHHNGGSSVLAVDKKDNVYLVEQYRYPYHCMMLEIPAGKVEAGESAELCAIRELKEEVGLVARSVIDIGYICPTPAYTDEPLHIFMTTDFAEGDNKLDEHELLNVVKIPLKIALQKIENNEIRDAKTIVAITRYILKYGYKKD